MKVPLVDLTAQYRTMYGEIDHAIAQVINSGRFVGGPEIDILERDIAFYCNVPYAVSVASGTDALSLSLMACGVGQGDEVITTPFTFIATAEAISRCGAVPVFCDIEPETYNIDPSRIEDAITPRTKAILPVHLYGQPVDMSKIISIADHYYLAVVEDCAQALGATWNGNPVGSTGDAGCLSFFPSKMLGAYGDGGMVITRNPVVAAEVRLLKNHGGKDKYYCTAHGFNSRLDAIQASILNIKLRYLYEWVVARRHRAGMYADLLDRVAGIELPRYQEDNPSVFNYYTIRVANGLRDDMAVFLKSKGVDTAVYYPTSLHLQPVYRSLGYGFGSFPVSEKAQGEVLSLPMYPEMSNSQVEWVCDQVKKFMGGSCKL